MNNAGLPGTGLGGLFYLLLALGMPLVELGRSAAGRSDPDRQRQAFQQFAMACGIVAAVAGTMAGYLHLVDAPNPFGLGGPALVTAPLVLAVLLLSVLVVGLRVWARIVRDTARPT